ncbi:hypothetical protein [Niveibacterium sp.]|uniref:hypothetical protein n=1 Tax=Niveibacterium sp. TaxID=2017444 RepID=UPI0035B1D527
MGDESGLSAVRDDEQTWKSRNLRLDTFVKAVSVLSILAAVVVAANSVLSQRREDEIERLKEASLNLQVEATATALSPERSLVLVGVKLSNSGIRTIYTYSHQDDGGKEPRYFGEGCTISVTRHELPQVEGAIPNDRNSGERVVRRFNILEGRYTYANTAERWDQRYKLKPGAVYRETEAFVLKRRALYEIVVRFYAIRDGNAWTNTETKYLYVE